jgi:uncharacterized protein
MEAAGIPNRVVSFTQALRAAGLPLGLEQTECFARALELIDVLSRDEVYFSARATLVTRFEDLAIFDQLFAQFFDASRAAPAAARKTPMAPRHDPRAFQRTALASYLAEKARSEDPEVDIRDRSLTASEVEVLQKKDFATLTEKERWALKLAMRSMRWQILERRTRRRVRARRGDRLDQRRILQRAARSGGKLLAPLPYLTRKLKPRPLLIAADLSGSMELYARIVLQFLHGLTQHHSQTETFVFGTRLTRITPLLKLRDVDRALDRVSSEMQDFAGGTRIGECLRDLHQRFGRRVLRSGAVVLIVSDGCERGDVSLLSSEMRWLHGRSYRLIWLNPRIGGAGYRPAVRGMAAALPYTDDFLPIHNLESLQTLATHLSRLPTRRGGTR